MTEPGTSSKTSAQTRVERHALASEILRVRAVLVVAWASWFGGIGFDLLTRAMIGGGPLWLMLVARLGSSAYLAAVAWHLYHGGLETPRLTRALIVLTFPVATLAESVLAACLGGLTSPYVTGVFVILVCQVVAIAMPWQRAAVLATAVTWIYPLTMLVGCAISPVMRAQLDDPHTRNVFLLETMILFLAGTITTWASHGMWSLQQRLFESRSIGRYRLLRRIGRGGMGEVWRAHDRVTRRDVALKILVPQLEHEDQRATRAAIERFEREIDATARLAHPHVVRIFDWGVTDDGIWYYAMELLEGLDLAQLVETQGPLAPAAAVRIGVQAARALGAAHAHGIVHRDVKPANLFVVAREPETGLRVLDFGVARVEGDDGLTHTGFLIGTPAFMAPELAAGRPADARSDVWSLAATLRFALTGKTPRDPDDAELPAELAPVLGAALDPDPARRPRTGDELADALAATPLASLPGALSVSVTAPAAPASVDAHAPTVVPRAP
jgi:serine/threonine-protein kinase